MLKLKLQYFGHLMQRTDSKNLEKIFPPDAGKDWRQEETGTTEDEMVGWHHRLDGHEFEQALGVGDGQGSLACCSPWGHKESDTTEQLNWTELTDSLQRRNSTSKDLPFRNSQRQDVDMFVHKHIWIFITALFIITKVLWQPKYPSIRNGLNTLFYS